MDPSTPGLTGGKLAHARLLRQIFCPAFNVVTSEGSTTRISRAYGRPEEVAGIEGLVEMRRI